jgi:tRNA-splicing endonuclease subunit Sen2
MAPVRNAPSPLNGDIFSGDKSKVSQRPNFALLHRRPLPLETFPVPLFIPHNPLSYLQIAWSVLRGYILSPTSHPVIYSGYWSSSTGSVHVTDSKHVRALWEMGFFGKGSLSRSESTWLDQERKRLGLVEQGTSENWTKQRREERERLKRERAKAETAIIEQRIRMEADPTRSAQEQELQPFSVRAATIQALEEKKNANGATSATLIPFQQNLVDNVELVNQEHYQLSPEEALFLTYGLGVLQVTGEDGKVIDSTSLLSLCRQNSYFPSVSLDQLSPDDPFLLNYVVYHHFRSLGWVVRSGIKFSVDWLLYDRGPVFKHAAFAIMIIPSYTDSYWKKQESKTRTQRKRGNHDWSWLHCVNRVQTTVFKTLILVYLDIPCPSMIRGKDIGTLLQSYRVREFTISRWSANRNRG